MKSASLLIGLLLLLSIVSIVSAQADFPAMAAVVDGNLIFFYNDGREPLIVDSNAQSFANLVWSPDGSLLAYGKIDEDFNYDIMLTDSTGSTPLVLVDDWRYAFPHFSWTPDNKLLYHTGGETAEMDILLDVIAMEPMPEGTETVLATVPFGVGCGGGASYPGFQVYHSEIGGFGGARPIMEQVPQGIVYSRNCTAEHTVLFVPGTGEIVDLGTNLYNVDLSPDRSQLVGLQFDNQHQPSSKLSFVTLETREVTEMPTLYPVYDVQWTGENALFYATHFIFEDIALSETAADLLGMATLPSNYSRVVFYNPDSMREEIVLEVEDSFRVGRIAPTGNPLRVYVSVIPIGRDWLEAVDAGNSPDAAEYFTPYMYVAFVNEADFTSGATFEQRSLITPHPFLQAE